MKLYAARHGETTWNVEKRLMGYTPGKLTEKGRSQAEVLAMHIEKLHVRTAYASDLQRVVETVEIVQERVPSMTVNYTPALRERNFGTLEGKLMSAIDWDTLRALPARETLYAAESLFDFTLRVAQFITQLYTGDIKAALLFTHVGTMNRLSYLSSPREFSFTNYGNADTIEFDAQAILTNSQALLDGSLEP